MTIDRELVTRKCALIVADLKLLEPVGALGREAFVADPVRQAVAERLLERIIGRMIDINFHLLTEMGRLPPKDFYSSFTDLVSLGLLELADAKRLAASTGLRNRLAHEYDEVDPEKVHEALGRALKDVPAYLAAVQRFVDSRPE